MSDRGMKRQRWEALGLLAALLAAVTLLLSLQWFEFLFIPGSAAVSSLSLSGFESSAGFGALMLANLALLVSLLFSTRGFQRIFAILQIVLGAAVLVLGITVVGDPVESAQKRLSEVSGLSDGEALVTIISEVHHSGVLDVAFFVSAALLALTGVFLLMRSHAWPVKTAQSRYANEAGEETNPWDELDTGGDFTA